MVTIEHQLVEKDEVLAFERMCGIVSASEGDLRVRLFCGNVVLQVGSLRVAMDGGWVPILDFAFGLKAVTRMLRTQRDSYYEFMENGARIIFCRIGDDVRVTSTFIEGQATVPFATLVDEIEAFMRRASADCVALAPALERNPEFERLMRE